MKKLEKILAAALVIVSLITCVPITSAAALSDNADDILFDAAYYAIANPDLAANGIRSESALRKHWEEYGKREGRRPSVFYDPAYYKARYHDIAQVFGSDHEAMYNHFKTCGVAEQRQGSADFNVAQYRENYEDLRKAFGSNTLQYFKHYREHGRGENRVANAPLTAPVTQTAAEQGVPAYVSTSSLRLNIRTAPSTKAAILTKLARNTSVTLLSTADGWCKIRLNDGRIGYASAQYIKAKTTAVTTNTNNNTNTNTNNAPSTAASLWPKVSKTAYLEITCPVSRLNVYTTSSLSQRGVAAPQKKAYSAYAEKGDKLYVFQFSGDAAYLSYPAGGQRKEGWVFIKDLFGVSQPQKTSVAQSKQTTYTYPSYSNTSGYIAKGDQTYTCSTTSGFTLMIYEAASGQRAWKAGYISTGGGLSLVMVQTIPTGVNLSVTNRAKENGIQISNGEGSRSAANLNAVIDQYTVTSNTRYKRTSSATWCNIFVWDVTRALKCEIPHWVKNNAPVASFTGGAQEQTANRTYN